MKPLKLAMQAFGAYAGKEEVDFTRLGSGLFLMTGPTGSGKTTVFDAIKYALFGEMSGTVREVKSIRSGYASPATITYVELLFEHNGKKYRAYRAPGGYRVESKRKTNSEDGLKNATEEVCLECITDGVSLAGKSREMSAAVEELLGLSAEQFGNIVMIAQGEFTKLLNAPTKDRQGIFRKVFSTELYLNAQKALKDAAAKVRGELRTQNSFLENELRGVNPSEGSQYLGVWQNLRSQGDFEYHVAEYSELLRNLIDEDSDRLEKGAAELAEINDQLAAVNSDLGAAQADKKNREELAAAEAWVMENAARVAMAEAEAKKQDELKPQRDALREKIALLSQELPKYEKHATKRAKLAKLQKDSKKNASELQRAEESCEKLAGKQAQLSELLESLGNLEALGEKLKAEENELGAREKQIAAVKTHVADVEHWKKEHAAAQGSAAAAIKSVRDAEHALADARAQLNAQLAGVLASQLADGEPCPVCGSREHPCLAMCPAEAPTEECIESMEKELEAFRATEKTAVAKASESKARLESAEETLRSAACEVFGANCGDDLDGEFVCANELLKADRAGFAQRKSEHEGRVREYSQAKKGLELLGDKIQAANTERETCAKRAAELEVEIAACRTAVKQLGENLRHASLEDAEAEVTAKTCELNEAEGAAAHASEQAVKLNSELAAKNAVIESRKKSVDTSKTYDIDVLQTKKDELEQKSLAWSKGIGDLQGRIKEYESKLVKIGDVRAKTEKLESRYKLLNDMSGVANAERGSDRGGAGRVSFEAYVQAVYFRQVLVAANERLRILSDMRYELQHKQYVADARSLAGLDMEVLDRNTGKTRDVSSLSGGETFLASLSLALGFADVIQAQASGVRIDAMFIDEGFGSLDEETCATALKVLDRLAEDDRLVGVISHVDQLKRHIFKQVVIEKDVNGSHVRLEV